MKTKANLRKCLCMVLFAVMLLQALPFAAFATELTSVSLNSTGTYDATFNSLDEMEELLTSTTYGEYIEKNKNLGAEPANAAPIYIAASDFAPEYSDLDNLVLLNDVSGILAAKDEDGLLGEARQYVLTNDEGEVGWVVDIPKSGYYNMALTYFPFVNIYYNDNGEIVAAPLNIDADAEGYPDMNRVSSSTAAIERIIKIDGEVPFKEARTLTFSRVWKDEIPEGTNGDGTEIAADEYGRIFKKDVHSNEIRSKKYEDPEWRRSMIKDSNAFYSDSFDFYLEEGTHVIQLASSRESFLVSGLEIFTEEKLPTYAEVLAQYESKGYKPASYVPDKYSRIEAEMPVATSEQVIYPINDKSSAITSPQASDKTLVNTIGGDKWQIAGQWIDYEFTCPETGLYYIVPRARQSVYAGMFSSRALKINGEYPFEEAKFLQFNYSDDWQTEPISDKSEEYGDGFQFYFEEGKTYTISFEVVLGKLSDKLREVDESLVRMNEYYRKILMITGPEPSTYLDYDFAKLIPEVLRGMRVEADNLNRVLAELQEIIGEKGEHSVLLEKVAYTLETMGNNQNKIADNLDILKSYIGSLGTWLLSSRNQPLAIDFISVQGVGTKMPKAEASFFESMGHEIVSFVMSFFTDYNSYGAMEVADDSDENSVEVWITDGRDQAQIMREMVDDFVKEEGIAVNYKLVAAGTLLPATLAGIGPDVATDLDATGYGVRSAVRNLAEKDENGEYVFEDFDEVQSWFSPSAWTGLTVYNPDGDENNKVAVYGVPVTQNFSMLFYRKDIFVELGLEVPETWDDVQKIIEILADSHMTMGLGQGLTQIFMYQKNEPYYLGDESYETVGYKTNLDSNVALDCFKKMCEYFSLHGQPVTYDFANRFRTGEMPIGIADYTLYNQLSCFAPEIKGLWEFIRLPGTPSETEPGKINHTAPTSVNAVMIMNDSDKPDNAWKYIKWWVGEEAQSRFGKEQVAILGTAAKYHTANVKALLAQPWSSQELKNLEQQFNSLTGTPMTPGNYILARYTNFAFLDVVDKGESTSEAMYYYIDEINKELTRKRAEYDFPTYETLLEEGKIEK